MGDQATTEPVQTFETELGPSQFPVTVWLDATGRLRQLDMNLVLIGATADVVFDVWGFGPSPSAGASPLAGRDTG